MNSYMLPLLLLAASVVNAQQVHHLTIRNDVFEPEFLVVEAGDPIALQLSGDHTLTQVSAATFRANGAVSNGGVRIGKGLGYATNGADANEATFTLLDTGDHYFVSEGSKGATAKVRIVVIAADHTGISAAPDQTQPTIFPNPAADQIRFRAHEHLAMMSVEAYDQSGRLVMASVVRGNEPLNLMSLPPGHYLLRMTDGMSKVYGVERLVIDREGS